MAVSLPTWVLETELEPYSLLTTEPSLDWTISKEQRRIWLMGVKLESLAARLWLLVRVLLAASLLFEWEELEWVRASKGWPNALLNLTSLYNYDVILMPSYV